MATALTLTGLTGYVEENAFELLSKAVLQTNLAQYITVRAGLQGNSADIPLLADDFALVNDAAGALTGYYCGWNDNGNTTLSQVNMKIAHPKVQRAYCVNTLRDTFMSQQLSAGAQGGEESLPFEAVAANYFTQRVTKYNEDYLISGAVLGGPESGDSEITYTGIQGQCAAAVTAGTMTGINQAAWTASNAYDLAMAIYAAMPAELMMRDDNILVLNPADYKALVAGMVAENLYHFNVNDRELFLPATNVRVVMSSGIPTGGSSVNFKFLTSGANIIMGTDLTSDFDEFRVWYSQDNDEVRASMKWAVGVAIVQPELVIAVNEQ